MSEDQYQYLRRTFRASPVLGPALHEELHAAAARLVRYGRLPASASPGGVWNQQAEEDILQAWVADRLLGEGQIQSLLDKAPTVAVLRRLLDRSLRQHVLNSRQRSESQNIYKRLGSLLEEDPAFRLTTPARRRADTWWALADGAPPQPYQGSEDALVSALWGVGDVTILRYRADSRYLSPVISTDDLRRLTVELLTRAGGALTLTVIARAFARRFDLEPARTESLDAAAPGEEPMIVAPATDAQPGLEEAAVAVLDALTERQSLVLIATDEGATIDQIAERIGCSVGTVVGDRRAIAQTIRTFSADDEEAKSVLKKVADLLYEADDE